MNIKLTKISENRIRKAWNKIHPRNFVYAGNHWRKARSGASYGTHEFRNGYIQAMIDAGIWKEEE